MWSAFERMQVQTSKRNYYQHLKIFEALYLEAKNLGVFPLKDPLEGIEVDIHLAAVLNVRSFTQKTGISPSSA